MSTRSAKGGRATNERTTIVETENTCLEIYTQFIKFYRKGQDRPLTGRESIFISISWSGDQSGSASPAGHGGGRSTDEQKEG